MLHLGAVSIWMHSHLQNLPFIQLFFQSMKFSTYIIVPFEDILKSRASLLSPFHPDFARQNPSCWSAILTFYDTNLSSIIQVHSSLCCIQNTVSSWNCKEIKNNKSVCDVCQDIHQACHSMLEIVDRLCPTSNDESDKNRSNFNSQMCMWSLWTYMDFLSPYT